MCIGESPSGARASPKVNHNECTDKLPLAILAALVVLPPPGSSSTPTPAPRRASSMELRSKRQLGDTQTADSFRHKRLETLGVVSDSE